MAAAPSDEGSDDRAEDQRDLVRPGGCRIPEEHEGQSEQTHKRRDRDEGGNQPGGLRRRGTVEPGAFHCGAPPAPCRLQNVNSAPQVAAHVPRRTSLALTARHTASCVAGPPDNWTSDRRLPIMA